MIFFASYIDSKFELVYFHIKFICRKIERRFLMIILVFLSVCRKSRLWVLIRRPLIEDFSMNPLKFCKM